jgi:hypothetical protein
LTLKFGKDDEDLGAKEDDFWPEIPEKMYAL